MVDIYLESQERSILLTRRYPSILDSLPKLNDHFEYLFEQYFITMKGAASDIISKRLVDQGINSRASASIISTFVVTRKTGDWMTEHLDLGYILKINNDRNPRYFAIVPHHCDLVIEIPSDHEEQTEWVKLNLRLFFHRGLLNELLPREHYVHLSDEESGFTTSSAVNESIGRIFDEGLPRETWQEMAFGETFMERTIGSARDLVIPGHSSYVELKKGHYWRAAFHAAVDAAPYLGKGGKLGKKLVKTGVKQLRKGKKLAGLVRKSGAAAQRGAGAPRPGPVVMNASETIRSFTGNAAAHSDTVARELKHIKQITIDSGKLETFLSNPKEKCEAALAPVIKILKDNGYETKVRGMFIWTTPTDYTPANHFIVIAKKNGQTYAVDITAAQFSRFGINAPIIETEENWARTYHNAISGRKLIKYNDFPDARKAAIGVYAGVPAEVSFDLGEGTQVLSKPRWYLDRPN